MTFGEACVLSAETVTRVKKLKTQLQIEIASFKQAMEKSGLPDSQQLAIAMAFALEIKKEAE